MQQINLSYSISDYRTSGFNMTMFPNFTISKVSLSTYELLKLINYSFLYWIYIYIYHLKLSRIGLVSALSRVTQNKLTSLWQLLKYLKMTSTLQFIFYNFLCGLLSSNSLLIWNYSWPKYCNSQVFWSVSIIYNISSSIYLYSLG